MRASENWSQQRGTAARHIASVLYGVVAIMTADIVAQPDRLTYHGAVLIVFLIGFAMATTHLFVHVVTKETERRAHLAAGEFAGLVRDSAWVLLFPAITAGLIVIGALVALEWKALLEDILYVGMATIFMTGFWSSYILDRNLRLALRRAIVWLLLSAVLTAAKSLI